MQYQTLGRANYDPTTGGPYMPSIDYSNSDNILRIYQIRRALQVLYKDALRPGISSREQKSIDEKITALECELDSLLNNRGQSKTPGGYYTGGGVKPATGGVVIDTPALVLGDKEVEGKKKFPWWLLVVGGAAATYFSVRG